MITSRMVSKMDQPYFSTDYEQLRQFGLFCEKRRILEDAQFKQLKSGHHDKRKVAKPTVAPCSSPR